MLSEDWCKTIDDSYDPHSCIDQIIFMFFLCRPLGHNALKIQIQPRKERKV